MALRLRQLILLGVADKCLTALSGAVASAKIFLAQIIDFACTCLVLPKLLEPDLMFIFFFDESYAFHLRLFFFLEYLNRVVPSTTELFSLSIF